MNASSSRNGKKILSQLQEATQSHQVSHQGCGTPVKNPAAALGSLTPKSAKMPTAFTNLFNKKKETSAVIDVDQKKSKKRKREPADIGIQYEPCCGKTSLGFLTQLPRRTGVLKFLVWKLNMSRDVRKPAFWFPTRSDTNQAVLLQKMARGFKFQI